MFHNVVNFLSRIGQAERNLRNLRAARIQDLSDAAELFFPIGASRFGVSI